jgi:hypothetical protein
MDLPGEDSLTSSPSVALWFQRDAKLSTMINLNHSMAFFVDLSQNQNQSVTFHNNGVWTLQGKQVDYFSDPLE